MQKNKLTVVLLIIIALLIGGFVGYAFTHKTSVGTIGGANFGGTTRFDSNVQVADTLTYGQIESTSTAATTATLTVADLSNTLLSITPNTSTLTVTLPASTTVGTSFLPNPGDSTVVIVQNATGTAGVNVILAGGTGTTLVSATSTKTLNAGSFGTLNLVRLANSNIEAILDVNQ